MVSGAHAERTTGPDVFALRYTRNGNAFALRDEHAASDAVHRPVAGGTSGHRGPDACFHRCGKDWNDIAELRRAAENSRKLISQGFYREHDTGKTFYQ